MIGINLLPVQVRFKEAAYNILNLLRTWNKSARLIEVISSPASDDVSLQKWSTLVRDTKMTVRI